MHRPVCLIRTLTAANRHISHELLHPYKYRKRFDTICCNLKTNCWSNTKVSGQIFSHSANNEMDETAKKTSIKFKKALIVSKLSRYEFEQHKNQHLNLTELEGLLRNRGTDYEALMKYHHIHKDFETKVADSFKEFGIEVKLVNRVTLTTKQTRWADVIVPIGGDGTFLLSASRACPLLANDKPIIGFNSDPSRSEGRLMLPKKYSNDPKEAIKKLLEGDFQWLRRSRIRITMLGQNGNLPKSNDLQELQFKPMELNEYQTEILSNEDKKRYGANVKRILPYLALNEVFIGETLSARVSHLQLRIDNSDQLNKTKSSGLCVSTGTGSSSWQTSINRLSTQNVDRLLRILEQVGSTSLAHISAEDVATTYNNDILFKADDPRLCYSIREQVCVGVWPNPKGFESKGFATTLLINSRCIDATLVIDGSIAYPFNDGAKVLLEVHPKDSLLTVTMNEK